MDKVARRKEVIVPKERRKINPKIMTMNSSIEHMNKTSKKLTNKKFDHPYKILNMKS